MKKGLITAFLFFSAALISADIEVVITASRVEEPTLQSPYNTIVLTEEDLKDANTLEDALAKVPGLSLASTGGSPSITARGFGENGFGRFLILKDGEKLNRPDMAIPNLSSISISQISKIEIVLGAPSVTYGSGAVAGVVNIITKKDPPPFKIAIGATVDSYLGNTQSVDLSGKINDVAFFISGFRNQDLRQRERTNGDSWGVSTGLTIPWLEKIITALSFSYSPSFQELAGGLNKSEFDQNPNQFKNPKDQNSATTWNIKELTTWNWDSGSVSLPISFRSQEDKPDYPGNWTPFWGTYSLSSFQAAPTVNFSGPLSDKGILTTKIGAEGNLDSLLFKRYSDGSRSTQTDDTTLTKHNAAGWLLESLEVEGGLIFTGGLRTEWAYYLCDSTTTPVSKGEKSTLSFAWNGSVNYSSGGIKSYLNYAKVFRSPFVDEQVSYQGYYNGFNSTLDPEIGHSFDLGTEWQIPGFTLKGHGYVLLMDGEIFWDNVLNKNVNLGTSRHLGADLSLSWSMSPMTISAAYNFTSAILTSGTNEGKQLPYYSPHSVDARASFEVIEGTKPWINYKFLSPSVQGTDLSNSGPLLESRNLLDMGINQVLKTEHLGVYSVIVQCKNILDQRTPETALWYGTGYESWYPAQGRTIQLSGRWEF